MNPHNNGNAVTATLPESGAESLAPLRSGEGPEVSPPVADQPTWATRASALKNPATGGKKPILLLGGGIAAAVILFAMSTLFGKPPHKKTSPPQPNAAAPIAADKSRGSVTPLMDAARNPAGSENAGQLTPSDINRTKASTGVQAVSPTMPNALPRPVSAPGATLASVPPFDSTQQHWEEPKPYAEPRTSPTTPPQQQNLLKEASLVFVKKAEPIAKSSTISTTSDSESTVPQLNVTPGTRVQARLETQASTALSAPVVAVVEYTYSLGTQVIVPAGARVYGQLQQADRSGAVNIKFNEIELLDGNREKIEAIATSLELGPIKGTVSGKNTGKNFLVRTASGIGSVAAMLVGNSTSTAFSQDDLIRERVAQNVGNAGDTEIMNMAVSNHVVVSVPADTPIYIVFTKRESGSLSARPANSSTPE